jgi:nucleoside-diphosphate-sugar epimerase
MVKSSVSTGAQPCGRSRRCRREDDERSIAVIEDKRILLTGPAGGIGFPLASALAQNNEVWGISRFQDPAERAKVDRAGIESRPVDLATGEFGGLPDYFDYVLHLSAYIVGDDFDRALTVNAEGTALLMTRFRTARAILVMSTNGVYRPHPDPWHAYLETDPLGDANVPGVPTYSVSKIAEEAVARSCARQMGISTIICRMNSAYGVTGRGGLPGSLFDRICMGQEVVLRSDPNPYSPINDRDIFEQTESLLDAARPSCPIVNWGGDEAVPTQDWCRYFGELLGVEPVVTVRELSGTQPGVVGDCTKRMAITGPCRVGWREGMKALAEARMEQLSM